MFTRSIIASTMLAAALGNVQAAPERVPTPPGETKYSAKRGYTYKANGKKEVERRLRLIAEGKIKVDA